jgi:hypothetical protein
MAKSRRKKATKTQLSVAPARGEAHAPARAYAAQLRADIDHGRTVDKVAAPDPSVAPLGTDDESAGQPPTADQVEPALARERSRAVGPESRPTDPTVTPRRRWAGPAALLLLIFTAVVLGVLFLTFPA